MISHEIVEGVATLTLSRPEARNALPIQGWRALEAAARVVAASDARVAILRSGVDGVFSAGADLKEFRALIEEPALRPVFREAMRGAIEAIAALPIPVIAAIDGGCFGAGVALALAADLRVAADGARFAVPPARMGITYPREDVARLVRQVGRGQAARLLFSAVTIDAVEAGRIGLVELVAADAGAAARTLAGEIAANVPAALRLLKHTLDASGDAMLDAMFDDRFGSPEFMEKLSAPKGAR